MKTSLCYRAFTGTVRQRTDLIFHQCANDNMQSPLHEPAWVTDTLTHEPEPHGQDPVSPKSRDFAEAHDDPEQAEELERQQDA